MIQRTTLAVAMTVLCATLAAGQAFDVATIKPNTSSPMPGPGARRVGFQPGGRFIMVDGAAVVLIRTAFPDSTEVIGAPDWVSRDHYDVEAKADGDPSLEQMQLLVRTMLADRFKLIAHEERREKPTYALMLANDDRRFGPNLRRYAGDCASLRSGPTEGARSAMPVPANGAPVCGYSISGNKITAGGITIERLAGAVGGYAGREIIDRTGLAGEYEFTLEMTNDVTVFTALREQLGLKLEPSRDLLPVVVVERIERPTPD